MQFGSNHFTLVGHDGGRDKVRKNKYRKIRDFRRSPMSQSCHMGPKNIRQAVVLFCSSKISPGVYYV